MSSQEGARTVTVAAAQQSDPPGRTSAIPHVPRAMITRSIIDFRNKIPGTQVAAFSNTTYAELCNTLIEMQEKQESRLETMNLARIQYCLTVMQQFTHVIEIFLNVSDAVAYIWGPMKYLLLTASTFADSFDSILDAYERIGEELPSLAEYRSLFHNSPHMINALELIYIDILEFHRATLKLFSGRLWIRFFRSMWNNYQTKFDGTLSSLRRHKDIIECRASVEQYRIHQESMIEFKEKLEDSVLREEVKNLMIVKEWLNVGELPQLDHDNYCRIRADYANTSTWILQHEIIDHWIHSEYPRSPVVWMHGIPGAGKTILASAIVDECKGESDFTTCFVYCHDGDSTSNTAVGVLKGLADQLLDAYPQMLPPCYTMRRSSGEPSLRSLSQARKLLENFCSTIAKLFIIIDGLDECEKPERQQVLEVLGEVVGYREVIDPGTIRLLIASQDHADIRIGLHGATFTKIAPMVVKISEIDNERDIQIFTSMWVDRIAAKFPPFTDDMKEYLQNLTVANAKGMFLYAKLALLNIHDCTTFAELMDSIKVENFPHELADQYEMTLRRIKIQTGRSWPKARKLLGWLACAKRSLTWKEIQVALSIDIERQIIDYENQRLRDHIYHTCGSLVLIRGDRVSLVHSTFKTYITAITKDIHEPSIECELATLCLEYLTFPCFDVDNPDDVVQRRRYALDGSLAFQDYAIAKWFHHVNAWVASGRKFLEEAPDQQAQLDGLFKAMDNFMSRYSEVEWEKGVVEDCKSMCRVFQHLDMYDHIVQLTSHIYTFQQKGFEARHKISISDLSEALNRNRKVLEEFPRTKPAPTADEKAVYKRFYDEERRFKCPRLTCRYFSEGFKDVKSRNQHVNIHERPYQCEIPDCIGAEGFVDAKDLEKHTRTFHPEKSDLAETFVSAIAPKRGNINHACSICGKTFSRSYHRRDHELSHKGERPHECEICGKAFTRLNDLTRHKKIHDRDGGFASSSGTSGRPSKMQRFADPGNVSFTPSVLVPNSSSFQSLPSTDLYAENSFPRQQSSSVEVSDKLSHAWSEPGLEAAETASTEDHGSSSFQEAASYTTSSNSLGDNGSIFDVAPGLTSSSMTNASDLVVLQPLKEKVDTRSRSAESSFTGAVNEEDIQRQIRIETRETFFSDIPETITNDDEAISIVSNKESIGSQDVRVKQPPGARFASRKFGDFLGNLEHLRPLHEEVLRRFGKASFLRNYRRLLKIHFIRLCNQPDVRTRTESLTLQILKYRENLVDIARQIAEAIESEEAEQPKPHESMDFRPREEENVAAWVANLRPSETRDRTLREGSVPSDREEFAFLSTQGDDRSDSDQEDEEEAPPSEHRDSFKVELLSRLRDAYEFLQRDLSSFERDIRLLLLPAALRDVLETVPTDDISISCTDDISYINKAKEIIEDRTSFDWDWWPLRPRRHKLSQGRQRLEWKVSWHFYSQEIAHADSSVIQAILDQGSFHPQRCYCCTAPAATASEDLDISPVDLIMLALTWIIDKLPTSQPPVVAPASAAQQRYTPSSLTANASTITTGAQSVPSNNLVAHSSTSNNNSSVQQAQSSSPVPMPTVHNASMWVIFGIKDAADYSEIENIQTPHLITNDEKFFTELRRLDHKYRWTFFRWLSPWIFDHCKFVRFDPMDIDRFYCWGESLPEDHGEGAHYEYDPRPPGVHCSRNPPINKNTFRRYLRTCRASCFWTRLRFLRHRCSRPHPDSHKWMRIPRKKVEFDISSGQPGTKVYGIEAVYSLSFFMVFVSHVVIILSMVAVSIWWQVHHPGDLQNAFTPLATILAIMASFWCLPGRGREN